MKKVWKIAIIVFASLLALVLLTLLLVSPMAKSYVNRHGEELVGRKVHVDQLKVHVLGGCARIANLTVYEDDGITPFVSIDTIDAKVSLMKLLRHELDLKHITVVDLDIRVLQDGSHFNFSSIIDHFREKQDTTRSEDTTSSGWALGFYNIRLSHWKIDYQDLQRGSHWDLKDLNIKVPGVYFSGERSTDADLMLEMADGGNLAVDMDYNMQSNDFNVDLGIADFAVSNAKAYLTDAMNVGTVNGLLSGRLTAIGNLSQLMNMSISGKIQLTDVNLVDTRKVEVLALDKLTAKVRHINIDSLLFDLDSVALDGVNTHFDRYATTNNFSQFLATDAKKTQAAMETSVAESNTVTKNDASAKNTSNAKLQERKSAQKVTPKKPQLRVRRFTVRDSRLTFNDHTLESPFSLPVSGINIDVDDITLKGAKKAHLMAYLPHGGQLNVLFRGNMSNIKQNTLVNASIRGLQLAMVSPYSVHYTAYPFNSGTFSFSSENTIINNKITGKNNIDIYKPEVGEKQKVDSALHIPLKAALYVLTDKDGKVVLDVPVSGDLNDPKFSYWKAVWKTLGNLLVKVAVSPFNKISEVLGINSEELKFIQVDPMQQELSSEQLTKLEQLSRIAAYDSSIVIILAQQINADAEDEILQFGEKRNQQVRNYMLKLGVKEDQLMVLTQEDLEGVHRIGYKVDSEVKSPEEE